MRRNLFLDILYPRHCPVCHEITVPWGRKICDTCKDKLKPIYGARCFCCSKPLQREEQEYCKDCRKARQFQQGLGIFPYSTLLQNSLFQLKYGKRQEYGTFYGEFAAYYSREKIEKWRINLIIPIPLHLRRLEKRGYNQAGIIAEALGKKLGIPVDERILKRQKNTKPQKELNHQERQKNMRNAFVARKKLEGENILLVDDIYTTGSTIEEAAKELKKAGAQKIFFLTVAIGADS